MKLINIPANTRLKAIDKLMDSDTALDADSIPLEENATEKEKRFAKLITQIYKITHPYLVTGSKRE